MGHKMFLKRFFSKYVNVTRIASRLQELVDNNPIRGIVIGICKNECELNCTKAVEVITFVKDLFETRVLADKIYTYWSNCQTHSLIECMAMVHHGAPEVRKHFEEVSAFGVLQSFVEVNSRPATTDYFIQEEYDTMLESLSRS